MCRLLCPDNVVETGVARGVTSYAILTALEQNGNGKLYSIELPLPKRGYAEQVGEFVPTDLRCRWELLFGPSTSLLPRLLERIGPIDMFLHDSSHDYHNQRMEYRLALCHMRLGGILVSDDVNNDSLLEEAQAKSQELIMVRQRNQYLIGLAAGRGSREC